MRTVKTISLDYEKSPQERECDDLRRKARSDALCYIGISKKTSGRITGWLLKKGYPDSIIDFVIKELADEGMVNDRRIAMAILDSRNRQKAESSSSALRRLLRLGIDRETAKECIEEAYQDRNKEISDAIMLLRLKFTRKIDTMNELDQTEQRKLKQKMFRYILNRGYDRETAMRAMNSTLKDYTYEDE